MKASVMFMLSVHLLLFSVHASAVEMGTSAFYDNYNVEIVGDSAQGIYVKLNAEEKPSTSLANTVVFKKSANGIICFKYKSGHPTTCLIRINASGIDLR